MSKRLPQIKIFNVDEYPNVEDAVNRFITSLYSNGDGVTEIQSNSDFITITYETRLK